jgi:hypothetical protein
MKVEVSEPVAVHAVVEASDQSGVVGIDPCHRKPTAGTSDTRNSSRIRDLQRGKKRRRSVYAGLRHKLTLTVAARCGSPLATSATAFFLAPCSSDFNGAHGPSGKLMKEQISETHL